MEEVMFVFAETLIGCFQIAIGTALFVVAVALLFAVFRKSPPETDSEPRS